MLDCDVGDKWNFIMLTTEIGGCLLKQLAFITLTNTLPKLLMKAIAWPHGNHQSDLKVTCLCHLRTPHRYTQRLWGVGHDMTARY